jgi:hypothetical protein
MHVNFELQKLRASSLNKLLQMFKIQPNHLNLEILLYSAILDLVKPNPNTASIIYNHSKDMANI